VYGVATAHLQVLPTLFFKAARAARVNVVPLHAPHTPQPAVFLAVPHCESDNPTQKQPASPVQAVALVPEQAPALIIVLGMHVGTAHQHWAEAIHVSLVERVPQLEAHFEHDLLSVTVPPFAHWFVAAHTVGEVVSHAVALSMPIVGFRLQEAAVN